MKYVPVYKLKLIKIKSVKFSKRSHIDSVEKAALLFREYFKGEPYEKLSLLMLNDDNQFTGIVDISTGITTQSLFTPRQIFAPALLHHAEKIVVAHNHPVSTCEHSDNDKRSYQLLKRLCKEMCFQFEDFIIISEDAFYSFRERNTLLWEDV